jgi:hypothetical protein
VLFDKTDDLEKCLSVILELAQQKQLLDHILVLSRKDADESNFEVLYPNHYTGIYHLS